MNQLDTIGKIKDNFSKSQHFYSLLTTKEIRTLIQTNIYYLTVIIYEL